MSALLFHHEKTAKQRYARRSVVHEAIHPRSLVRVPAAEAVNRATPVQRTFKKHRGCGLGLRREQEFSSYPTVESFPDVLHKANEIAHCCSRERKCTKK